VVKEVWLLNWSANGGEKGGGWAAETAAAKVEVVGKHQPRRQQCLQLRQLR